MLLGALVRHKQPFNPPHLGLEKNDKNNTVNFFRTNKSIQQLQKELDTYNEYDFARGGTESIATVLVKAGQLKQVDH